MIRLYSGTNFKYYVEITPDDVEYLRELSSGAGTWIKFKSSIFSSVGTPEGNIYITSLLVKMTKDELFDTFKRYKESKKFDYKVQRLLND